MNGTASDILVKYLEQEGVEYLFGVPGGHLLQLYDAVHRAGSIKPILTKHEAWAALMAYGYAATSGKIVVCCRTVGPGATNLVTGVASAYMDSVPMLVLTAQVGTSGIGRGALQEGTGIGRTVNQVALFDKITKLSTMEWSVACPPSLKASSWPSPVWRPWAPPLLPVWVPSSEGRRAR